MIGSRFSQSVAAGSCQRVGGPSSAADADHFYGDADQRRRSKPVTAPGGGEGCRGSETGGLERSSNHCVSGGCCSDGDATIGEWLCDVGAGSEEGSPQWRRLRPCNRPQTERRIMPAEAAVLLHLRRETTTVKMEEEYGEKDARRGDETE